MYIYIYMCIYLAIYSLITKMIVYSVNIVCIIILIIIDFIACIIYVIIPKTIVNESSIRVEEEERKLYFNNLLHIHQHTFLKYMIQSVIEGKSQKTIVSIYDIPL